MYEHCPVVWCIGGSSLYAGYVTLLCNHCNYIFFSKFTKEDMLKEDVVERARQEWRCRIYKERKHRKR